MTIHELNNEVVEKLKKTRKEGPFSKYLEDFFHCYQEKLFSLDDKPTSNVIDDVRLWCDGILNSLRAYNQADMVTAILTIQDLLKEHKNQIADCTLTPTSNNKWYRMRNLEPHARPYKANEMFHVPFSKRGKLGNYRFSISGYPCLYLGKTIWACWEELHEPDTKRVCVSKADVISDVKLLDLSWPSKDMSDCPSSLASRIICTWPLIIACSIRTLFPDDTFKPEYIIPQLVMLAIKNGKNCGIDYMGCLYTSTQQNEYFSWGYDFLTNAAIPVSEINTENEKCPVLNSKIKMTDSKNEEYARLMGIFDSGHVSGSTFYTSSGGDYNYSMFGLLEHEFDKK